MAKKINAHEFVRDIKAEMDDESLMMKYDLTRGQLDKLQQKAAAAGLLTGRSEQASQPRPQPQQALTEQNRPQPPLAAGTSPVRRAALRCPKCSTPHELGQAECAGCGVSLIRVAAAATQGDQPRFHEAKGSRKTGRSSSTLVNVIAVAVGVIIVVGAIGGYQRYRDQQDARRLSDALSGIRPTLESLAKLSIPEEPSPGKAASSISRYVEDSRELVNWMNTHADLIKKKNMQFWEKLTAVVEIASELDENLNEIARAASQANYAQGAAVEAASSAPNVGSGRLVLT